MRRFAVSLVLAILLSPVAFSQDIADNVVIVLDASGSMSQRLPGSGTDKMSAAKAALKQVLKTVPENTHIGLLVFSAKDLKDDWVYPLGPRDDARLTQAIDGLFPHGGTPLGAYLKKGADRLLEARAKQFGYGTFRLLVVTDGEAGDQNLVERFTPDIIARGITVDVIGVAMNERHTLATKVHSYRSANDPASLQRAIAEVFGEIGGSGSRDVASAEAFAELNPIPAELAQKMIQALAVSGNQPIGERQQQRIPPTSAPQSPPQGSVSPQPPPQQTAGSAPPAGNSTAKNIAVGSSLGGLTCLGFFALIVLVLIRALRKSRR